MKYFEMISAGTNAMSFMKASYSIIRLAPLLSLPPEILERIYMYCAMGRLSIHEVRKLYPAAVLLGMEGITDRAIAHCTTIGGMQPTLPAQVAATLVEPKMLD